jgi:hypothetical protein
MNTCFSGSIPGLLIIAGMMGWFIDKRLLWAMWEGLGGCYERVSGSLVPRISSRKIDFFAGWPM